MCCCFPIYDQNDGIFKLGRSQILPERPKLQLNFDQRPQLDHSIGGNTEEIGGTLCVT